ncbi:hypothetical protein GIB67_035533 [Kingdonia uniflora]|uniref:GRAM domain-containing protein n=1 Tax=Kingdonia uniflora TaxID=39325 RepID=A0A7J7MC47_9MAGN|nr:hypothetical protein GIB67_035533 [Kingdonia uniflora]
MYVIFQVCLHIKTSKLPVNSSRVLGGYMGANARRRISLDKEGPTVVHQKPGPLQTIFSLHPDEASLVVDHSYSCALERSFLYHGRMYVSAWHICFHSNVFSKQMKPWSTRKYQQLERRFRTDGAKIRERMDDGGIAKELAVMDDSNLTLQQIRGNLKNLRFRLATTKKFMNPKRKPVWSTDVKDVLRTVLSSKEKRVLEVIIPFEDIDEIKRSQHAFINPAITLILRMGAGGHGVPPLGSPDGRVRYKFASFWNRNHALKALQRATKNFHAMLEAEKKARLRANPGFTMDSNRLERRP